MINSLAEELHKKRKTTVSFVNISAQLRTSIGSVLHGEHIYFLSVIKHVKIWMFHVYEKMFLQDGLSNTEDDRGISSSPLWNAARSRTQWTWAKTMRKYLIFVTGININIYRSNTQIVDDSI